MSNRDSFMQRWLPFAFALILCACGGGGSDDDVSDATADNNAAAGANFIVPENVFIATLQAVEQVAENSSNATGVGIIIVDPVNRLMRASLTTAGLGGGSASINIGPLGTDGPAVFPLIETPAGSGLWTAQTTLSDEQLARLRNGNYYFDVRSSAFPQLGFRGQIGPGLPQGGAAVQSDGSSIGAGGFSNGSFTTGNANIRDFGNTAVDDIPISGTTGATIDTGPLVTPGSTSFDVNTIPTDTSVQRITLVNVLSGAQQVPPNGSSAVAVGVVIMDSAARSMVASITSLGIAGLGAHIHQADQGVTGETVFSLNETSAGSGIWGARVSVSEAQLDAFADGSYYFDIHTAAFPDGELRGQIAADSGSGFTVNNRVNSANNVGTNARPFVTDREPGGINDAGGIDASVPTFGNPIGSGIGSGGDTGFPTGIPSLGNPAGSGIGSAADTGFSGSTVLNPAGAGRLAF